MDEKHPPTTPIQIHPNRHRSPWIHFHTMRAYWMASPSMRSWHSSWPILVAGRPIVSP